MTYLVKEIFGPTIQGEGAHTGKACVFLRFAACNLACTWCDTDFAADGARKLTAAQIAAELIALDRHASRVVVVTGGEPALQWDQVLADALRDAGFAAHMESNGTVALGAPVDWLTISPKPQFHTTQSLLAPSEIAADECKVVVDDSVDDAALDRYEQLYSCDAWYLQPCMDERYADHLERTLAFIERRPRWRLSVQLHKIVGMP